MRNNLLKNKYTFGCLKETKFSKKYKQHEQTYDYKVYYEYGLSIHVHWFFLSYNLSKFVVTIIGIKIQISYLKTIF